MRLNYIIIAIGLVTCFYASGSAQTANDPIDVAQAQCLKTHHGTMPRAKCYSAASDAWQKKEEASYEILLKILSPQMKKELVDGQTAWIEYQKEEEALISDLYTSRGTGYIAVRIIEITKAYKARALDLESHLQTVQANSK
ncbi:MAG: lysozyme inhibitor LprI family protein [Pyrinomonadaceae bacterium]